MNNGIIIIEGCDGTGKSTLACGLAEVLGWRYHHEGKPEQPAFEYYMNLASTIPGGVVMDRAHLGELVYPKVKTQEGRPGLERWQQHAIERVLAARGAVLVHARASRVWIERVFATRGEAYMNDGEIELVISLFECAVNQSILPKVSWQVERGEIARLAWFETIVAQARDAQHHASTMTRHGASGPLVGTDPFRQIVALVGEDLSPRGGLRAFDRADGSSAYLHQTLGHSHLAPWAGQFYLTNAYDAGPARKTPEALRDELELADPAITIALGARASQRLREINWRHGSVHHPQWRRRFAHDRLGAYALDIKQAITLGAYYDNH